MVIAFFGLILGALHNQLVVAGDHELGVHVSGQPFIEERQCEFEVVRLQYIRALELLAKLFLSLPSNLPINPITTPAEPLLGLSKPRW